MARRPPRDAFTQACVAKGYVRSDKGALAALEQSRSRRCMRQCLATVQLNDVDSSYPTLPSDSPVPHPIVLVGAARVPLVRMRAQR